ncbi:MAG: acyl-CoA dehydrogenase family protein [Labilibaculum antarcticum]
MANFYNDNDDLKFHLDHPLMKKIVALKERNFEDKETYDYAPLDFEDAMDSYDRTLEIVGEICGDIIDPNAESVDKEGPRVENDRVIYARGTQENHDALTKAGLIGMSLPREYDGLNFPLVPYVMAAELVSRADAGFANIWGLQDCAETIHEFASKEQKMNYLPRFAKGATAAMDLTEPDAGSDLQAVQLKATYNAKEDQWYLDGVKRFITNGDGEVALVLARSEAGTNDGRGLSMFIYDKKHLAVKVRRIEHKMGIIGSPTCELVFTHAPAELVGDRKMGLIKYVMSLMNGARLGVGAQSIGIAEAAYREGLAYAKERRQFGKAIIKFPAVYEMLTNMEAKLNASRSMLYETCRMVDVYKCYYHISQDRSLDKDERNEMKKYQKIADVLTPMLKLFASEYCNQIAYDSLQIHAGSGYMKDYPIERLVRDARITNIYEGTSQLQVVAAVRGVTTGQYLAQIKAYQASDLSPQLEYIRTMLKGMTEQYEKAVAKVTEINATADHNDFLDFHARRLVEMAGYIILGYLTLLDTTRNDKYHESCEVYVKMGKSVCAGHLDYVQNSDLKDLGIFKK